MSTYDTLRHFVDKWGLIFMAVVFIGIVLWALRPSARKTHEDSAQIPFREENGD